MQGGRAALRGIAVLLVVVVAGSLFYQGRFVFQDAYRRNQQAAAGWDAALTAVGVPEAHHPVVDTFTVDEGTVAGRRRQQPPTLQSGSAPQCTSTDALILVPSEGPAGEVLINIVLRHAFLHGLKVGLPADPAAESPLGWPNELALREALVDTADLRVLGTAPLRFSGELRRLVPGGMLLTVLQHPRRQFLGAWIRLFGPGRLAAPDGCTTPEAFALNFDACHGALPSPVQQVRVRSPQAYGLGLSPKAPAADVLRLVAMVSREYRAVLIAEHLDESLVVMAARLCWGLEEVAHLASPISLETEPEVLSPIAAARVVAASGADLTLFEHFNRSLWAQAASLPSFGRDLARLKQLKAALRNSCGAASQQANALPLFLPALLHSKPQSLSAGEACALHQLRAPQFHAMLLQRRKPAPSQDTTPARPQHQAQPGSQATPHRTAPPVIAPRSSNGTCQQPDPRVVWIKTHKTGSSTVTNIMHRAAVKHGARVVIPRGDLFLGWPNSKNLLNSYIYPLPNLTAPHAFDVFCSAHHRYNRTMLDTILPGANYVTLLRHPVSHYISSWSYWGIGNKLASRGKPKCASWQYYLDHRAECDEVATRFDMLLMHNSMTFDLGLDFNASRGEVERLRDHLQSFATVLITEHMDESLVLLKRTLCWDLEDVAYFSMKVTNRGKAPVPPEYQRKILEFNSNDALVYAALNATLWKRIAREPGFAAEVAEMRAIKQRLNSECAAFGGTENSHLMRLIDARDQLSANDIRCHLARLDSRGFSKYLKYAAGIPPNQWCSKPPQKKILLLPTPGTSPAAGKLLARHAIRLGRRIAVPLDHSSFGFPSGAAIASSFHPPFGAASRRRVTFESMTLGFLRYEYNEHVRPLIPHARHVAVLREPASQFRWAWGAHNMSGRLSPACGASMLAFVRRWSECIQELGDEQWLLRNPMAFHFGLDTDGEHRQALYSAYQDLDKQFPTVLFEERFYDSLVLMTRILCLPPADLEHIEEPTPALTPAVQADLDRLDAAGRSEFTTGLATMNRIDQELYQHFFRRFEGRLRSEISFKRDVATLRARNAELKELCAQYTGSDHLAGLHSADRDSAAWRCHSLLADAKALGLYIVSQY